jgi:hypothetical protein
MKQREIWVLVVLLVAAFSTVHIWAVPSGPVITYKGNSTSPLSGRATLENNATITGGVIGIINLDVRQANPHWKAYVGNVTGTYVLEDADNYSIYEWNISTITGEIYATRSSSVTWSEVWCANATHVKQEMSEMHHNRTNTPGDMINETFDDDKNDHWGFYIGSRQIAADSCNFSINPWINDSQQSGTDFFEEVVLYDNSTNLIYTSRIEDNQYGYRNDSLTYDFNMLIPENASPGASRTDYYFFVELG